MLILVAVTVRTVINSGLFKHAGDAAQKWSEKQKREANVGNDNYIKDTVNQSIGKQDRSFLKVGDYIDYTPDPAENYMKITADTSGSSDNPVEGIPQDKTLTWQVMSINDDGTVDIVSSEPIATNIYFTGAIAYNNAVYLLNDLCKTQYSNKSLEVTARSINSEDVESKFNSIALGDLTPLHQVTYGETKIFEGNYANVPDIYEHVDKTIKGESETYYKEPTTLTSTKKETLEVKVTDYILISECSDYFDNENFAKLIVNTERNYYFATRYTTISGEAARFGIRKKGSGSMGELFDSRGYGIYGSNEPARPVVTLGSNIKISNTGGTADNPRTLSK